MRILFYTGKGGVGKTTVACATATKLAREGKKTLVLSLDIAHSVADSFDVDRTLLNKNQGQPLEVGENLFIQELDIQVEIDRWFGDIHRYLVHMLNLSGLDDVVADEMAIMPGMEEISLLMYINQYAREEAFDVIVLDAAPTGESLRFISLPTALDWYMERVFQMSRAAVGVARPFMRLAKPDLALPDARVFDDIERLSKKLKGVDQLLHDPHITTVRLVTLPEKIVIKETQRAFMYFCLYGLTVDAVVVNRLIPSDCDGAFLGGWKKTQQDHLDRIHELFAPVPIRTVDLLDREIVGRPGLEAVAEALYGDRDPAEVFYDRKPHRFLKNDDGLSLQLHLPWVARSDIDITRIDDELIVNIGGFKKNIELPRSFVGARPTGARVEDQMVTVQFAEGACHE